MKLSYRVLLLSIVSMLFLACAKPDVNSGKDPDDPNNPDNPDNPEVPDTEFVIEVKNITTNSATFTFIPKDKTITYVYLAREKSLIGEMSDEEIQELDMAYFEISAIQNNIDVSEYLDKILIVGDKTINSGEKSFKPGTEYIVYCYGMTKYKEYTTEVVRKEFKTEGLGVVDCTFDINVNVDGCRITADIKPSDNKQMYWEGIIQESLLDLQYQGDISKAISGEIDSWSLYAEMFGTTLEKVLESLSLKGQVSLAHFNLESKSNYILYAAAIDTKGNVISDIATSYFATTETTPSNVKFDVKISDITYSSAKAKVTPTQIDPYLCQIVKASDIDGMSETAIMNYVIDHLDQYEVYLGNVVKQGEKEFVFEELEAGTDYVVCVFGYETVSTTALNRNDFQTIAAGDPADVTFNMTVTNIMDRSAHAKIESSDESVLYLTGVISEEDYNAGGANSKAIEDFIDASIQSDINYGLFTDKAGYIEKNGIHGTKESDVLYLMPDTKYYPFAICVDKQGEYLADARLGTAFNTEKSVQSEASTEITYDKHFNGDDMANMDSKFNFAKGKALVPVTLVPSVDVAHCYFMVFNEDITSKDPDELISLVWKYGTADQLNINATTPWNTPITLCTVSFDADGHAGAANLKVASFTKPKASPVDEYPFKSASNCFSKDFFKKHMPVKYGQTVNEARPSYDQKMLDRELFRREAEAALKSRK